MNYGSPAQKGPEESNASNWTRDHYFNILAKNVASFSPVLKLSEADLKSFGQILLEEISRLPNVDSITWLLVITIIQVYNKKNSREKIIIKFTV